MYTPPIRLPDADIIASQRNFLIGRFIHASDIIWIFSLISGASIQFTKPVKYYVDLALDLIYIQEQINAVQSRIYVIGSTLEPTGTLNVIFIDQDIEVQHGGIRINDKVYKHDGSEVIDGKYSAGFTNKINWVVRDNIISVANLSGVSEFEFLRIGKVNYKHDILSFNTPTDYCWVTADTIYMTPIQSSYIMKKMMFLSKRTSFSPPKDVINVMKGTYSHVGDITSSDVDKDIMIRYNNNRLIVSSISDVNNVLRVYENITLSPPEGASMYQHGFEVILVAEGFPWGNKKFFFYDKELPAVVINGKTVAMEDAPDMVYRDDDGSHYITHPLQMVKLTVRQQFELVRKLYK